MATQALSGGSGGETMGDGRQETRRAGVVGWPVEHSRSPQIFRHWFRRHGIRGDYARHAVPPGELADAFRRLRRQGLRGCNVTLPHKEAAFALADIRSPTAERTGSVNTVVFHPDGRIEGDSSDGFGFLAALRQGLQGLRPGSADGPSRGGPPTDGRPTDGPAVVLGAGGAARAVVDALAVSGVPEIRIVNRTFARAESLAREIPGPLVAVAAADAGDALGDATLLVNATSLGLAGAPEPLVDSRAAPAETVVMDLVYVPLETAFLALARARGQPVIDGLGMLLHQARPGFRRWFGIDPEVDAALRRDVLAPES